MKTAGICFLILGGVLLLISGLYFGAYLIFEKLPHKTDRTLGKLCDKKYKKDVAVWTGFGKSDGPPRVAFTIKHLTKSKYLYCVNNNFYLCVFDFWRKPNKIPNNSWVIYLKAFPRISYLDNDENCIGAFDFFVKAILFLGIAIGAFCLGVAFLSKA
ncbi:MAG: hypothetical protein IJW49_04300 [Clostridia bacterium]|nr:hypothetical protein [Clostridia bacterium]